MSAHQPRRLTSVSEESAWADSLAQLEADFPELGAHLDALPSFDLLAVVEGSSYLRNLILNDGARLTSILGDLSRGAFNRRLAASCETFRTASSEPELMAALRRAKQETALFLAIADLAGLWPVMEITEALTHFADKALQAAVHFILSDFARRGLYKPSNPDDPAEGSGLIVLAMGKMGAFELNYSSDIDLIVFFDAAKPELKDQDEASSLFIKLVRTLVRMIQERTAEGYVFRTDLRLRPDPGSTGVAISLSAALTYYESMGRAWERAAMIKARPAAGDLESGQEFLQEISPFVWRRYLDASVLLEVRSLKGKIEAHKGLTGQGEALGGRDLKLGRGGIREIEFLIQTKQLMLGGRTPDLRHSQSLVALERLTDAKHFESGDAADLRQAYLTLRTLEHRVQMLKDEQSHKLPDGPELDAFARFAGYEDRQGLSTELARITRQVSQAYRAFFHQFGDLGQEEDQKGPAKLPREGLASHLEQYGFAKAEAAADIIEIWLSGRYAALRSEAALRALEDILPALLPMLAERGGPDAGLIAFDHFLKGLPAGVQLFSLFHASPALLELLVTILGVAPRLAEIIRRRPQVLGSLLDLSLTEASKAELLAALRARIQAETSEEACFDDLRLFVKERQFVLGAHFMGGAITAEQAAQGFTETAEIAAEVAFETAWQLFRARHGMIEGGAAVLIALGRLGASDMTAHSDLDLIMVYDFSENAGASDGDKPLMASTYFIKLTQKLVTLLSAPTAEGSAYELDFRLRPSGNSGPLAVSLEAFERYQLEEAWTWEHMALTRARVIGGDPELAAKVEALMAEIIAKPREAGEVYREVAGMRKRITDAKPPKGLFDLKLTRGGLLDLEFMVQALLLVGTSAWQKPTPHQGAEVLRSAADQGILTAKRAENLIEAWAFQKGLTQILRLISDSFFEDDKALPGAKRLIASGLGLADFEEVKARLSTHQNGVAEAFSHLIERA